MKARLEDPDREHQVQSPPPRHGTGLGCYRMSKEAKEVRGPTSSGTFQTLSMGSPFPALVKLEERPSGPKREDEKDRGTVSTVTINNRHKSST